ncbi:hypothetical protein L207DRAFT_538737 [Hyaloscypha variabilis F]|uniref:Granulins domain-containing protein n=1 Tax=Hyaloscypha variabilis (strain UAMH 11265 / GT02V1 / F) TaxID=1149755 RepID=A0A2J6QTF7_HYAVF|nr:hypothetical protein L207DRAFT_538737 [Hyaloscypha variabilis F]
MALSRYSSHSIFWLVFSLCVSLGFTSDVYGNELAQRSNSSFYGGVALWQTIVETTDVCPSDTQTCSQGLGTCCPEGTYCEDSGWFCCPIDVDCSAVVKAAPVCADPSWGLYEATGNGDVLFCCLPGTSGLAGSGCEANSAFASGGASLAMATSNIY